MTQLVDSLSKDLSWADPILRVRLEADPAAVLRDEGLNLPSNLPAEVAHEVARLVFLLWEDGQIIPRSQFRIDPGDEGLLFGRGLWESTKTVDGVPWLWSYHVDRLLATAKLVDIPLNANRIPTADQVTRFVRTLTNMDVIIRLNVTAGRPGRHGKVWMTASLPPMPMAAIRLQTTRLPYEKGHPYLTWKTFQYASRLRLGRQVDTARFDSTLLIDDNDSILEAAHANIFLRFDDGWATPVADGGLLPGTTRRRLLEASPWSIRERTIPRHELAEVREAFVTNSNVGAIPVISIDDRSFPVGQDTLAIARWLGEAPTLPDF